MRTIGDQQLLKRINRSVLLRLLRCEPGLSRARLSQHSGLTKSTVSALVRELLGWKGDAAAYAKGISSGGQSGNALAIVPSTKKVGGPGATLDVPLTHINACYVRSHFDAMEVRVPGAPRSDEMVVFLAMSTGPRIHARIGGLAADDIAKWDGQR